MKQENVISPIEFYPLQFLAECETQDGKIKKIPVNDSRLAGVHLPNTVENPQEFLKQMEMQLNLAPEKNVSETAPTAVKQISESDIVRAKMPIAPKSQNVNDIANFVLYPKVRYVYVKRDGSKKDEEEKIVSEIVFDDGSKDIFCLRKVEVSNICKIVKRKFVNARIDFEVKYVDKKIEDKFRDESRNCQVVLCYFEQGWQMINRKMIYVNQSAKNFKGIEYDLTANLPYIQCSREDVGQILSNAFKLYDNSATISTMIMYSFLAVLFRPFKEAGYPPKFLLFLNGKTGSMKTTIAKILFVQLCDDKTRDTPRRIDTDTVVSLERALVESGYDTVTLIDDYNPAKTRKRKAQMEEALEFVVRYIGDMSSKSRSNVQLQDCRGEGVQGTVVITGELRGKGLSSNLRCLYCRMVREKANLEAVTWFQDNPAAYTTVLHEFAEYVGKNWMTIVRYIKESFSFMRKRIDGILSERRLIDSVVTLQIVNHILCRFLREYCDIWDLSKIWGTRNIEQDILSNALMSQAVSSEDSPSMLFIRALNELMGVKSIVLATRKITEQDLATYDGFEDENYLYFNPTTVFKKVRNFYMASNIEFVMDIKEIVAALYDDGIIKTSPNGSGKQTYYARVSISNGKKQNFLKIHKEKFKHVLDDSLENVW